MVLKLFLWTALVAGLMNVASARSLKLKLTADDFADIIVPLKFDETFNVASEVSQSEFSFRFANTSLSGLNSFKIDKEWSSWESDNFTVYYATFGARQLALQSANTSTITAENDIIADELVTVLLGNISIAITVIVPSENLDEATVVPYIVDLPTAYRSPDGEAYGIFTALVNLVSGLKEQLDEQFVPALSDALTALLSQPVEEETHNINDLKSFIRSIRKN